MGRTIYGTHLCRGSGNYSRSHGQQGRGEPEGFPRVGLSLLIVVLILLAKTISSINARA
jgi:hypothetical protein